MNIHDYLDGPTDSPSGEVVIYGNDVDDTLVDGIRQEMPQLKISLSNDYGLKASQETMQQEREEADGNPIATTRVHVLFPDAIDKAVAKATDDAINDPGNTIVVLADKDDEKPKAEVVESFEKTDATVVNGPQLAIEALKERHP